MSKHATLEELAIYLPYGLKFTAPGSCNNYEVLGSLESYTEANWSIPAYHDNEPVCTSKVDYSSMWSVKQIRPILHPLNKPTDKLINEAYELYGGGFVNKAAFERDFISSIILNPVKTLPFETIKLLAKHHYDLHGLIDRGAAIDINTLNQNHETDENSNS